jgi:hypothetical protein
MIRQLLTKYNPKTFKTSQRLLQAQKEIKKPRSVIFFTTHKCASSFMNQFFMMVSNNSNYRVVDYASSIWGLGDSLDIGSTYEPFLEKNYDRLYFQTGEIYAPQRKPIHFPGVEKFKHIYFLRDPRDVLVSAFYSFGSSHSLPQNTAAKDVFLRERENIQKGTIDDYVRKSAVEWILPLYKEYQYLRESADSNIFLSYDLFNSNFLKFIKELSVFLNFTPTEEEIEEVMRANEKGANTIENISKHRRSGKSGQFRDKLLPGTIDHLNELFSDVLTYWEFKV